MGSRFLRHPLLLVAAFFAVALVALAHHEMWRDEFEYWDVARTSGSLAELRENSRYVGQPPLWGVVLFALTRITSDPRGMQALNLLAATLAVTLVATRAPFPLRQKWLLAFGYFPLFEYGTISRYYALGLLLLIASCAALCARPRRPLLAGVLLALASLTHFHATLVALAALIAVVLVSLLERRAPKGPEWGAVALVAAAIAGAIAFAIPPPDSSALAPFRFDLELERFVVAADHVWSGYAPLPPLVDSFWNRNLLEAWPRLAAGLGLLLVATFGWAFRRRRGALLFYLGGTAALFLFCYAQRPGLVRHDGVFLIVLLLGAWLAQAPEVPLAGWAQAVFTGVLAVNVAAGAVALVQDFRLPFTRSDSVAEALRAPELAGLPVIGDLDFVAAPIAARLGRPFYFMSQGRFGTHVVWSGERRAVTRKQVLQMARIQGRLQGRDVVLVLNYILAPTPGVEALGCYERAIVANETYCLYRMRAEGAAGSAP